MEEKDKQLHRLDPEEDTEVWKDILNNPVKSLTPDKENKFFENLYRQIDDYEQKKNLKRFRIYSSVAATIILTLFGLIGYNYFFKPDIYLAETQNFEVSLSDGSMVILSKGSKLTVEKSFPADTRDVFLEGDAIFKVSKSKEYPFIVHGNRYETKVLGTVFKVYQSGKTFKVDLFEGKVLVYKTGHPQDPVPLAPKQTFTNYGILEAASVSETVDNNTTVSKAKSASLTFNECPMIDAVQAIEKTYGIRLNYPRGLDNTEVTLTSVNATAKTFIQKLAIQLNLKTKQTNEQIFELEK